MTWINEGLPTAMRLKNYSTRKILAKSVGMLSVQEDIPQTSYLSAGLEALSTLKSRVDSLLVTAQKCNESPEITLTKILDLFSSEISSYEKALLLDILAGQNETDSNII
jgi:hypothetical protein